MAERKFSQPPPRAFKFSPIPELPTFSANSYKYKCDANIQNEFGVCGWILTILSYLLIIVTLPISACMCIKVVQEYERAVIFRLGRLMPGGAKGPGIFFIVPCIDTYRKVDLRVLSFEVPPQEILSKDSVTVAVDAVVYFRISNATISVTNVEDAARSTKLLAQTTLRNILGTKTLAEMLSDREAISHQMQNTLDEATEPWGVKVERVEVKDVRLPVQLQRAMAAEAEAAREARAKVIVAEGEQKASRALKEAAEVIAESPSALQLRYLQTLNSISAEKNSTIIFPFPIDLLSAFLQRPAPKVEEPPALPKKIRSCCLYKYPDWVQGMVGEGKAPVSGGQHPPPSSHWHPQAASGPSTTTTSGRPPLPHSMREAQYHSGANSFQPTAAPTQLDPGQLDASRRSARVVRGASGGANSLLKQAIANRLKPCPESSMTSSGEATSKEDEPMNRSIVGNAAWYRDDEGRTGFKPKEWENLPNQQKEVVKSRRRRERQKSGETVETIDDELLKEDSSESKKEAEDDSKEADEEKKEGTKMTKEEKKELKRKEKEEKKREKEEKKKEKEEKKRLEKEEKKRRSTASLDKASEEGADDKKEERKETKEEKKERKRKEKEEKKRSGSSASLDKEDGLKAKSQGEEKKTKEAEEEERKRKERHEQRRREKSEERKRETETRKKKEESPMIRRESESSVASSSKSTDTVKKAPVIHSPRKPPRPPPKEILGSPHSSSTEEERVGRTVAAHKQPKKTDIGERRDSSLSESSRISGVSHKSVTFSDKVQMHEIERIQMSSSEDDVAVMSDDEMSKPDSERRRRLVKLLQSQQEQEYSDEDEEVEIEEEDDFEEQERLIEQQMYPVYNLEETGSHGSFYPEELDPDRYLLDDDGSYISLDKLPASVRRAIAMEMKARAEENNMGSMSKLHEQGSPLLGYQLPRSASGYLDDTYMVASYQQAMYGAFHPDDGGVYRSPKEERINRDERRNLHESFYDNVPSGSNSGQQREPSGASLEVTPVPSPPRKSSSTSIDRRAFFEDTGSSTPSPPRVVVTQTPGTPQKVTVTTTTTSTLMTNRTEILEREERMRKGKEKDEDEMKRKFVAKFGARKAPMAEEDPLDPGPTNGSQESLYSTDSRESVVSEVSIRRENLVRRNFNY